MELLGRLFVGLDLLGRRLERTLQLAAPCRKRPRRELRLLRLAFERAQLLARLAQLALGADHVFLELGMALLLVAQRHVELLEARFAGGAALVELLELAVDLAQLAFDLPTAAAGLLGLLGEAQQLDLQLVAAALQLGRLATGAHQALRHVGIGRLGAHQGAARVFRDQRLRAHLALEVLDLLGTGQHAGLLGIGRVEGHRELRDGMALAGHDDLAMRELAALGQRLVQRGCGVHAFEPVVEQRLQALLAVQAQHLRQGRQRLVGVDDGRAGRRVERQPRRRRIVGEGAHRLDTADFERIEPLAQGGLERGFPAGLDVHLGPQALQAFEAVLGEPGLELAFGLHLLLQRAQGFQAGDDVGLAGRLGIDLLLLEAAILVELRGLLGQLMQALVGDGVGLGGLLVLARQVGQSRFVGSGQGLALAGEAFTAHRELAGLFVDVARLGREQLDLLLHAGHRAALLVRLAVAARRASS